MTYSQVERLGNEVKKVTAEVHRLRRAYLAAPEDQALKVLRRREKKCDQMLKLDAQYAAAVCSYCFTS